MGNTTLENQGTRDNYTSQYTISSNIAGKIIHTTTQESPPSDQYTCTITRIPLKLDPLHSDIYGNYHMVLIVAIKIKNTAILGLSKGDPFLPETRYKAL